jgi:hypothetical protein
MQACSRLLPTLTKSELLNYPTDRWLANEDFCTELRVTLQPLTGAASLFEFYNNSTANMKPLFRISLSFMEEHHVMEIWRFRLTPAKGSLFPPFISLIAALQLSSC